MRDRSFSILDCKFQCGKTKAYNAFKNLQDVRKTIKILDVTLASVGEIGADEEDSEALDDWVGQMYEIIKKRARNIAN